MKKTGRFILLLLALAIVVLSLSVMALAADTTYSITINGDPNNTVEHTYEAYQIFAGDLYEPPHEEGREETVRQDKVLSNIVWGEGVDQERTVDGKKLSDVFPDKTAAEVAKDLSDKGTTTAAQEFAAQIAPYLSSDHTDSNGRNEDGSYLIANLEAGYYLVKDKDNTLSGKDDFHTAYMMKVVGDVQATPKGEKPALKKQVRSLLSGEWSSIQAGYQIGDEVKFRLIVSVPNISGYADYVCTIDDTMTAGLTSNVKDGDKSTVTIKINNDEDKVLGNDYYEVTAEGNTFHVKIDIKEAMKADLIEARNELFVYYTAKLNDSAAFYGHPGEDTSNKNTASLTYPNDPNGDSTGKTPDSIVKVWTFSTELVKIEGTNTEKVLNGAKFVLSLDGTLTLEDLKLNDNYEPQESKDKLIAFVVGGETAPYEIATQEKIEDANTNTTYVIEIGKTALVGLGEKTYYLYEIKAPDGYNLLKQPIKYEIIMPEGDMSSTAFPLNVPSTKVDDVDNRLGLYIYISNNAGATLPETGGIGTTLFYVIGGLLVVGAGVLLVTKKRMGKTEN